MAKPFTIKPEPAGVKAMSGRTPDVTPQEIFEHAKQDREDPWQATDELDAGYGSQSGGRVEATSPRKAGKQGHMQSPMHKPTNPWPEPAADRRHSAVREVADKPLDQTKQTSLKPYKVR